MRFAENELKTHDGMRLFVRRFEPSSGTASRTVIIVHGLCEHGTRYDHISELLTEHSWNVVVPDLRGHGRSDGVPVHVKKFRHYIRDVEMIHRHYGLVPERTALLGHSMGGLVSLRFAQLQPDAVGALVLMSPLLAVKVPIPLRTIAAGRVLSFVAPRTRFRSRVAPCYTTHNEEVLARRMEDPLMHRSVTAGWYFAMKSSLAAAWKDADRIDMPVLIMQAGDDKLVDEAAPGQWLQRVPSDDTTLHDLPDHYHELLNEPDWRDTSETVFDWLNHRIVKNGHAAT